MIASLKRAPSALAAEIDLSRDSVLGIMDFSYAPYSLGDTMTWLTNLQITAHLQGVPCVDIVIVATPERASSHLQQHTITTHNYVHALESVFPAFFCAPMVRTVRVYEASRPFSQRMLGAVAAREGAWPPLVSHFKKDLDYATHRLINAFFRDRKFIPLLRGPRGYRTEHHEFRRRFLSGREPIVVNIRRRTLSNDPTAMVSNVATLSRDSAGDAWDLFFATVEHRYPSVTFVVVGGFSEWERGLARRANVLVPRAIGYGLGLELALLLDGAPFMGTSSGFSAAATFSDTPYVITNFEHQSGPRVELEIGAERYPFATGSQWLSWDVETEESLLSQFERLRSAVLARSETADIKA
jgi:hypothetical protein